MLNLKLELWNPTLTWRKCCVDSNLFKNCRASSEFCTPPSEQNKNSVKKKTLDSRIDNIKGKKKNNSKPFRLNLLISLKVSLWYANVVVSGVKSSTQGLRFEPIALKDDAPTYLPEAHSLTRSWDAEGPLHPACSLGTAEPDWNPAVNPSEREAGG